MEPELGQEPWPGMKLEHVAEAVLSHPGEAEWLRHGLRSKATSYREGSRTFTGQVGLWGREATVVGTGKGCLKLVLPNLLHT